MPNAESVARYLLLLSSKMKEPTPVTHLHLQKCLYYAQGWHLALRDRPLFTEHIEAWTHGPVVPQVYPKFADFGDQPITQSQGCDDTSLSSEDRRFIEWVWDRYGRYSAWYLREMTHQEAPWRDARGRLPPGEQADAVIAPARMRDYFTTQHQKDLREEGFDPDEFAAGLRDVREGRTSVFIDRDGRFAEWAGS